MIEQNGQPLSVREDRIKIVTGGKDEVTSVEFLGSVVRLKVNSSSGRLTVILSDEEFEKLRLEPGNAVTASWSKRDQLPLEA